MNTDNNKKRAGRPEKDGSGTPVPMILAPAGNKAAFLAAIAAGADAIYCGLKQFSARMAAKNFQLRELAALTGLAHAHGISVYVTLNTMLTTEDLHEAGSLLRQLAVHVQPDALIFQDPAIPKLAGLAGFKGELHLSTLANVSFPSALSMVRERLKVQRVVIPRELSIDDIKAMAAACPTGVELEAFIHGALCYGVSGRCYWSSYLGGKSGLRGRCVQPCRRQYERTGDKKRFFSCLDLSVDVLVKVLASVPEVKVWKIEGRKKSPHYVYYTTMAYKMLRDHHGDPRQKRAALALLEMSLGRPGTHYHFLPQRPQTPFDEKGQTASGLFIGRVVIQAGQHYLHNREALLSGDVLRIGYEDEPWHAIVEIGRFIPKKGKFHLNLPSRRKPPKGTPVFLKDRREKALNDFIRRLETQLEIPDEISTPEPRFKLSLRTKKFRRKRTIIHMSVGRDLVHRQQGVSDPGYWADEELLKRLPKKRMDRCWWWLPPVVWPDNEERYVRLVRDIRKKGGHRFVLNAPWQQALFKAGDSPTLWAGPFCNISNCMAIDALQQMGFAGVIVSPELGRQDYVDLPRHSPLPVGIIVAGNWPLCVSRTLDPDIQPDHPFSSPRGETAVVRKIGDDYWLFPNWRLDITARQQELISAGFDLFVTLNEKLPVNMPIKKRPGLWNWKIGLD
ncbi:MAG: U32 family peptidase [Desulfobacteraceae bacterium]|nr:U32 family peptidase [Desulfobacteraceae bacterium]